MINEKPQHISGTQIVEKRKRLYHAMNGCVNFTHMLTINLFPPFSFLFRRDAVDDIGFYDEGFAAFRMRIDSELAHLVGYVQMRNRLHPVFVPMHTFVVGGDDREYARVLARWLPTGMRHEIRDRVYGPDHILEAMDGAAFALCMRYHSVVFAEELGVPYLAVDYTGGGKIDAFLAERECSARWLDREDIVVGHWRETVDRNIPAKLLHAS
jgi:hypothetical protein